MAVTKCAKNDRVPISSRQNMQSSFINSLFLAEAIGSVRVPSAYPPKHFSYTFTACKTEFRTVCDRFFFFCAGGGVVVVGYFYLDRLGKFRVSTV